MATGAIRLRGDWILLRRAEAEIGFVFSLSFISFMFTCLRLLLSRCLFPYQWGLSPEWVKPSAEGGGICFLFMCFCFAISRFVVYLSFIFVYIANMADGR
jgi:hypothetical protein